MEAKRLLMLETDAATCRSISDAAREVGCRCEAVATEDAFRRSYTLGNPGIIVVGIDPGDDAGPGVLDFLVEQACRLPVVLVTTFDGTVLGAIGHLARLRGLRVVDAVGKADAPGRVRRLLKCAESYAAVGLRDEIERALRQGEIVPYYQPIYDLTTCSPIGVEALMRWNHAQLGLLPASDFAGVAEDAGVFDQLAWHTVERALEDFFAPAHRGWSAFLSLNASPRQLAERGFADRLLRAIRIVGGCPHRVTLEVTESSSIEHPARALALFGRLRSAGVRLALDDFGKGYSSLALLQRMPFDILKLDREFVRRAPKSRDARVILATLVGLGRSLGLAVIAEGIESAACLDVVRELDVTLGQGFHLGLPVPCSGLARLLEPAQKTLA